MSFGIDIRIYAQRNGSAELAFTRHLVQALQFRNRLDIEAKDVMLKRKAQFLTGFSNS